MSLSARQNMALLGALLGLLLWRLDAADARSAGVHALLYGATSFIVIVGLVVGFANTGQAAKRLVSLALTAAAVFGSVSAWIGWQIPTSPAAYYGDEQRQASWIVIGFVAIYALMPFIQTYQETGRRPFPHPRLFEHAWNNFFIGWVSGFHALVVAIVLVLWAALFELIGIDFFGDLFEEAWFIYPVGVAALGYGLTVAREHHEVISTLRDLARKLLQAVSVLLSIVSWLFIVSLLFTGLGPLFDTQSATSLLYSWVAVAVLCLNAVVGDGRERPALASGLIRILQAGVLALPVLVGIAGYALSLRVSQYGFTPDRIWALAIVVIMGAYGLGYAVAVFRAGAPWLPSLHAINRGIAAGIVLLAILLHTPAFDPIRLSVASQVALHESGRISPEDFDYDFFRFSLGHRGHEVLGLLGARAEPGSTAAVRIAAALEPAHDRNSPAPILLEREALVAVDTTTSLPAGLTERVIDAPQETQHLAECGKPEPCPVFQADIRAGDELEWVIVGQAQSRYATFTVFFEEADGRFSHLGTFRALGWRPEYRRALEARDWRSLAPKLNDLEIGGHRFELRQ